MDVDTPNLLKRCSSAPLINEVASTTATSPTTSTIPRSPPFFGMFSNSSGTQRTRRFSYSYSPVAAPVNPVATWGRRLQAARVDQLRYEECADVSNTREVAHERETHSTLLMNQSCEDITLQQALPHSPTRIPRFSPAVSPSPTRKYTTRRSLSPIAPPSFSPISRPTHLVTGKRRCDDGDSPVSKRMCTTGRITPSTPGTPDSDSLECTFRPVSPRVQPMNESPNDVHRETHTSANTS